MIFYLDENFPKKAVEFLEEKGHTCHDPRGTELQGCDDAQLVVEAQKLDAIILTTDRDFFHTLRHEHPDHAGLIVIALKQPSRAAIIDRLDWLLQKVDVDDLPGRAFQLRDRTWVAQPPLPDSTRE